MAFDGIVFRNDAEPDGTKWLDNGKGSDLTAEEIDENFWTLLDRLKAIEDNPPEAASISNIQVVGSQLTITLTDASSFGPFTLPIATFQMKNDPVVDDPIFELDIIVIDGGLDAGVYLTRLDHLFEEPFDPAREISGEPVYLKLFGQPVILDSGGGGGPTPITFFLPKQPGDGFSGGDWAFKYLVTADCSIPVDAVGSYATLDTAPTTSQAYEIWVDADFLASVNFEPSEVIGTWVVGARIDLIEGNTVKIKFPSSIDTDARNLTVAIKTIPTPA